MNLKWRKHWKNYPKRNHEHPSKRRWNLTSSKSNLHYRVRYDQIPLGGIETFMVPYYIDSRIGH